MRKSHNLQGAVFHIYMENTPVGDITLVQQDERIARLSMGRHPAGEYRETTLLKECERQLWEYFKGERRAFDLPVYARGTSFQQKVWTALSSNTLWGDGDLWRHSGAYRLQRRRKGGGQRLWGKPNAHNSSMPQGSGQKWAVRVCGRSSFKKYSA